MKRFHEAMADVPKKVTTLLDLCEQATKKPRRVTRLFKNREAVGGDTKAVPCLTHGHLDPGRRSIRDHFSVFADQINRFVALLATSLKNPF